MQNIRTNILRAGSVKEFQLFLSAIDSVYNGLYAFDWAIADYQTQDPRNRNLKIIANPASVVPQNEIIQLTQMWAETGKFPGWMQFRGKSAPIETFRTYVAQVFTAISSGGGSPSQLATIKAQVIQSRVTTLNGLGAPSNQINDAVASYFNQYAQHIDPIQQSGLVGGAISVP